MAKKSMPKGKKMPMKKMPMEEKSESKRKEAKEKASGAEGAKEKVTKAMRSLNGYRRFRKAGK